MKKNFHSELEQIRVSGKALRGIWRISDTQFADLKGKNPEALYEQSNRFAGVTQIDVIICLPLCCLFRGDGKSGTGKTEVVELEESTKSEVQNAI